MGKHDPKSVDFRTNLDLKHCSLHQEFEQYCEWLSDRSKEEIFLNYKDPEEICEAPFSIWAVDAHSQHIVGGAVVYRGAGMDKKNWLKWDNKLIVELGTNYVSPLYRTQHLASKFVEARLAYTREMNFFPVSITQELAMQKVLGAYAEPIEVHGEKYLPLKAMMRDCACTEAEKPHCKTCLLANRVMWVYKDFL